MKVLTIAESLGEGVISLPKTLWHGLVRTEKDLNVFDYKEFKNAWGQNWRFFLLLKDIASEGVNIAQNNPLKKAIAIILKNYYETLPECAKQKIISNLKIRTLKVSGRLSAASALSILVARRIARRIVIQSSISTVSRVAIRSSGLVLSIQGFIEEAAQSSDRLKSSFPRIYFNLKKHDLDMIYFLIEKPMQKYLRAIRRSKTNSSNYVSAIENIYCTKQ